MASELCRRVISHVYFERVILFVIIINSVYLAIDDNTMDRDASNDFLRDCFELAFSVVYLVEFCLKICGLGIMFNKGAYLRD
jgi:hypothetical protein